MTGSMPGIAASTSETWLFGSPPNSVEAPENSFDFEVTWAWISMPDHDFPVAGLALDQFARSDRRVHAFPLPSSADTIRSHSASRESFATGWLAWRYQ